MKTFIIVLVLFISYMIWYSNKVDTMVETHQTCTDIHGAHYIAPECE